MKMDKRVRIGLAVFGVAVLIVQAVLAFQGHSGSALWWGGFLSAGIAFWGAITGRM
ncbi:MAG: hypothetical protein ACLGPL_05330 [Acidobacteriota bacterium]